MTDLPAPRWEGATAAGWAERWAVPAVHFFARVGSTNDVARRLADAGAPAWTVVLADEQTAGRGRGGKGWASAPGLGIWLSVVLRPDTLPAPGLLPVLVGLAAAEAVAPFARPAAAQVKWPNDLYLAGRKAGGILCEGAWEEERPGAVVVGIGLNVGHAPGDFPAEVRDLATSLRTAAGWAPPRGDVVGALLAALRPMVTRPPERLGGALLERLAARDFLAGRQVRVSGAEDLTGLAMGVTPEGALLLRDAGGRLRLVKAGTVRPIESPVDAVTSPDAH